MGAKQAFCFLVNRFQRANLIQAASGERVAPLGKVKPALESKPSPVPSRSAQLDLSEI